MTDLKQAAQQALEALENAGEAVYAHGGIAAVGSLNTAAQALRAALAEPEKNPFGDDAERYARKLHEEREYYKALFAEHKPEQEPVRLQCTTCGTVYADGVPPQVPEQKAWFTVEELNEWAAKLPQTTHWEGCEAVHPECKTEHGVKNLADYEFKTYKTGGAELEAGFYSTDELRDLVKHLDKMNAVAERSMRKMK